MKTYLFDTFNRYKRFSEKLDAQTILCNKAWWVFNDSGEKEVYIFNADGTLIISVSDRVTNATWQYIPANESLIISGNNQSYMVKPAFFDNQIFALQVDGTNDYAFLIDENNLPSTSLRSLADLKEHFAEKERQATLAEERRKQAELAIFMQQQYEEKLVAKDIERERIKRKYEAEKWNLTQDLKKRNSLTPLIIFLSNQWTLNSSICIALGIVILWLLLYKDLNDAGIYNMYVALSFKILLGVSVFMILLSYISPDEDTWGEYLYKKHIAKNQKD